MCVNNKFDTKRLKYHRCNNKFDTLLEDKNYLQKIFGINNPFEFIGSFTGSFTRSFIGSNIRV